MDVAENRNDIGVYDGERQYTYYLGIDDGAGQHYVDLTRLSNFNMSLVGMSGSGKTYGIRQFLTNFWRSNITSLVLDTQGDLVYSDAYEDLPREAFVEHEFHHENGSIVFNPLQLLTSGQGGSYYAAVGRALKAIQFFHPKLGVKQKNALRELIMMTYDRFGIVRDDRATWFKPCPTVVDLLEVIRDEKTKAKAYLDRPSIEHCAKLRKKMKKMMESCATSDELEDLKHSANFEKEVEEFKQSVVRYIDEQINTADIEDTPELDPAVLDSVEPIIKQMVHSRLYAGQTNFHIVPGKVNVLVMREISSDERQALFFLLLGAVFDYAQISCTELNPTIPSLMLVFDETKQFATVNEDSMSPFPRIITEGRKFGMGSLLGFQSADQVSKEVRTNMSLSMVMYSARETWAAAAARYQVSPDTMAALEPKRDALVGVNQEPLKKLKVWAFD